jgi:hypothetical protein
MDAVLAGAGLAVLPTWLIQQHLDSGRLRRVLTEFEAARTPVYAVFPRSGLPSNKVCAFVDFLAERYRHHGILTPRNVIPPTMQSNSVAKSDASREATAISPLNSPTLPSVPR